MSQPHDRQDGGINRIPTSVAEHRYPEQIQPGMTDRYPSGTQGYRDTGEGEQGSPAPTTHSSRQENAWRLDEAPGGESSLTDLRGGRSSESLHDQSRRLDHLAFPHPSSSRPPYIGLSQPHPSSESRPDSYYPGPSSPYTYQPLPVRPDTRTQQYDYPPVATYDQMPQTSFSESPTSPTFHSRIGPHPWEYQYSQQQQPQPPTPTDRHPSLPVYSPGYIDPAIPTQPPPHHLPSVPGPSQHLPPHHQSQHSLQHPHQYRPYPLGREPYPAHPGGMGYPYSDSNQHASGSRHEYEQSASGSGSGYKERRTSLESAQGGKKPTTASRLGLDPVAKQERRREQNRIAQRAFRARAKIREQERSDDYDDDNQNEDNNFEPR